MTHIIQEPASDYHAHPAISRSRLWQFIQSRRAFERNEPVTQTDTMRLGTLVHALLLEDRPCAVSVPNELLSVDGKVSTKAAKAWRAEQEANGLLVLPPDEIQTAERMAASVRERLEAWLLRPSLREQSIYWQHEPTGLDLRCRTDWLIPNGGTTFILDLKTTESNKPFKFKKSIEEYGYHLQAVMYSEGVRAWTGKDVDTEFYFVGVEKEPPYVCCIHAIEPDSLIRASEMFESSLHSLARCLKTGNFADPWESEIISHELSPYSFGGNSDVIDVDLGTEAERTDSTSAA